MQNHLSSSILCPGRNNKEQKQTSFSTWNRQQPWACCEAQAEQRKTSWEERKQREHGDSVYRPGADSVVAIETARLGWSGGHDEGYGDGMLLVLMLDENRGRERAKSDSGTHASAIWLQKYLFPKIFVLCWYVLRNSALVWDSKFSITFFPTLSQVGWKAASFWALLQKCSLCANKYVKKI